MEKSKIVLKIFTECWNNQQYENIAEYLARDTLLHLGVRSVKTDPEDLKEIIDRWKSSFPDLRFEIHTLVEQGDHVATNMIMTGTHKGKWRNIEPTNREISVPHMFFFRFERGIICEVWELNDFSNVEDQLGIE